MRGTTTVPLGRCSLDITSDAFAHGVRARDIRCRTAADRACESAGRDRSAATECAAGARCAVRFVCARADPSAVTPRAASRPRTQIAHGTGSRIGRAEQQRRTIADRVSCRHDGPPSPRTSTVADHGADRHVCDAVLAAAMLRQQPMTDASPIPLAWRPLKAPSLIEFEVIATEALPPAAGGFPRQVRRRGGPRRGLPRPTRCSTHGHPSELDLMGLFQGVGLPFQSESAPVQMPNMVWLYRVPILLTGPSTRSRSALSSRMCWCTRSGIISDCPMTIW